MGWQDRKFRTIVVLVVVFCIRATSITAQTAPKNFGSDARLLKKTLSEKHIQPRPIDNAYSSWVYDNTLDELDPERLYFTQTDINTLTGFREKIDDDLNGSAWTFVPQLTQLYKKCLQRYKAGINEIALQPIDFSKQAYFEEDTLWLTDLKEIKKYWALTFRYHTQQRLIDQQRRSDIKTEKEFLAKFEGTARQHVQKVMIRDADRILNDPSGFETYVAEKFLGSMANAFDPHTSYFSEEDIQNFISSLSTQGYYFGITLGENEQGEVIISQLMPGGPAWKSGEIHNGDVLQVLRWAGQEAVDLWGMDIHEVNEMLAEPNQHRIELTLRKSDGTQKTTQLQKEKIESQDGAVKSFVLEGEHKIGYITLPDFYTDWGDADGSRCASDVAREIVKLKRENIEGLILDVRYNGGGSMAEAVAMAGIFIDAGPVGLIKNKAAEVVTVKDINRGTIYDGPLVIMVNGMSASASEFLAAALQDYRRAIIVGGRTYGKATAQQIMPTDQKEVNGKTKPTARQPRSEVGSYASVTIEKLYRITGKTAQQIGVVPDIVLPDALQSLSLGEMSLPLAFPADSVQKKIYYQPLPLLPLVELREKSRKRVASQPQFDALGKYGDEIASLQMNNDSIALQWKDFQRFHSKYSSLAKQIQASSNITAPVFKAGKLKDDEQRMKPDSYLTEFGTAWIENLQKDIFLNETFLITCDLISHVIKNK